jgi:F-type H+-transporting ATPase subunit delta
VANRTLARRYATAIFNLATDAGAVPKVAADLNAIGLAVYSNDSVRRFYLSPVFERSAKGETLRKIFEGKVGDIALHSLLLLVRKRREALLPDIVTEYEALALAASGRETLEIVSAHELTAADADAFVARLEKAYGKRFSVTRRTDPALLSGLRITMSDRRIDGSLSGRLDELARHLSTPHSN